MLYIVDDGKVVNIENHGGLDTYLQALNAKDSTPNTAL